MGNRHAKVAAISAEWSGQDDEMDATMAALFETDYSGMDIEDLHKEYVISDVLGEGSFGVVRKATLRENSQDRAVKIVESLGDLDDEWSEVSMMKKEATLLRHLQHPYIVRSWGLYEDLSHLYMVMDFCSGGELFNKLLEVKRFSEEATASMAIQMLSAISYLHDQSIMHRDIKAENFLLEDASSSPPCVVKLIDFGFASYFRKKQIFRQTCGSLAYMAPELLRKRYTHMVDMWAFGVLFYLLLYGQYPYRCKTKKDLTMEIATKEPKWTKRGISTTAVEFVKLFLEVDQMYRCEGQVGLLHPFIGLGAEPASPVWQRALSAETNESSSSKVKSSGQALLVLPQQEGRRKRGISSKQSTRSARMPGTSRVSESPETSSRLSEQFGQHQEEYPRAQQACEKQDAIVPAVAQESGLPKLAHRPNPRGAVVPSPPPEALPALSNVLMPASPTPKRATDEPNSPSQEQLAQRGMSRFKYRTD